MTGIVGGVVDIKNNITDKLNEVSPNVLGPIADALDPDWLIGVSYQLQYFALSHLTINCVNNTHT